VVVYTTALIEIAAEEQAARYQGDPWEEVIAPWLELRSSTSVSEVLERCVNKPQAQWTQVIKTASGVVCELSAGSDTASAKALVSNGGGGKLPCEVPRSSTSCSGFVLRAFVNFIWPHFDHYIWPHPNAS
jgi:hypothetical protein